MKSNVKGHLLDMNVFGVVYPVFQNGKRKSKFREPEEVRRKLEERRGRPDWLIHVNFAERDLSKINRKFECGGKSE